jgi:uncharacterized protein YecE (DUF72 family)
MQKQWHIGCSGFHYKEWKEFFYPPKLPQSKWFDHYAQQFNTLELNVTFYRFPQLKFLENWYNKSPEGFSFSAKVPRLITHYKQFKETTSMTNDFYNTIRLGLREKLGSVLFQLPPQLQYSDEALEKIISNINPEFTNVVEFRHPSWWKKKIYKQLQQNNIIFCGHSYPKLPEDVVVNNKVAYYRFHGVPVLYKSSYSNKFLKEVAETLQASKSKTNFIYFNNTWGTSAINNALFIQKLISKLK